MATTATALRLSSGAVVVPFYERQRMFSDDDKTSAAIVAKFAPSEPDKEPEDGAEVSEGLLAAAEDIMDVLQSYSSPAPSENASKVEKATAEAARQAKAKILARALGAFLDLYGQD